jgi:F-type H+-transporting ATPase subunit c
MTPEIALILGKYIGAGLAAIGIAGGGVGVGLCGLGATLAVARNPDARGGIMTFMILSIAFAEAVAIYALIISILLIFVV